MLKSLSLLNIPNEGAGGDVELVESDLSTADPQCVTGDGDCAGTLIVL
jgi:hypothetical protein